MARRPRATPGDDGVALGTQRDNLLARIKESEVRFGIALDDEAYQELKALRLRLMEVERKMVLARKAMDAQESFLRRVESSLTTVRPDVAAKSEAKVEAQRILDDFNRRAGAA